MSSSNVMVVPVDQPWGRHVFSWRSRTDPEDERQACLVYAAPRCFLETLVRVAGTRECIESGFAGARQQVELDAYEVCSAIGWDQHMHSRQNSGNNSLRTV